jgi:hypothetical protein
MDRRELLDRSRQELSKRADTALAQLGFSFSQNVVHSPGNTARRFFFTPASVEPILNLLRQRLPQQVDEILRQADKICRHQFDLLGYEDLNYGDPILWHLDVVHRKHAPKKPFHKIRYLDFDEVGDSKVTWELNRHQHLVTLAKAYRLTGNPRYADEIFKQWRHWHTENPYTVGINWTSSLEVAFRSLSWTWMYRLLEDTPVMSQGFRNDWLRAQAANGRHIERYLSTYFSPNTHLLGEAVALLFIGTQCPEISRAKHWTSCGWEIVLQQARHQVQADGFHFEQSTYYHVYAIDFFLHAAVLASLNELTVPAEFDKTLEKMLESLLLLGRAGTPPRLGDDDGGRLFDPRRNRGEHLLDPLATGAVLFRRGDFKAAAGELREEMIWLLGEQGVVEWDRIEARPIGLASASLSSAGLYVLTVSTPPTQLVIDAGPQGHAHAGHGHADALSICLQSQGHSLLIDPGTFEYVGDGPERDFFRSTAMHNTAMADNVSQSEPAGPFAWKQLTHSKAEQWIAGKYFDLLVGSHEGYARLASPVLHRRWVISLKSGKSGFFLVRDLVLGEGEHRLDIRWHLGPEMRLRDKHAFRVNETSVGLSIVSADGNGWSEEIREDSWSPVYGKKEPITMLNFGTVSNLPAEFVTLLVPLSEAREAPGKLTMLKADPGMSVTTYFYTTPSEDVYFFFAEPRRPWSQGRVSSDAEFMCWQKKRDGDDELVIFSNGTYVEIDGRQVLQFKKVISRCEMHSAGGRKEVHASEAEALI